MHCSVAIIIACMEIHADRDQPTHYALQRPKQFRASGKVALHQAGCIGNEKTASVGVRMNVSLIASVSLC